MKYFVLGVLILGVLLCVCLTSALTGAHWIDEVQRPFRAAYPALRRGDWEAARPLLEDAAELWEERHAYFECVFSHGEADEVNHGFYRLHAYLEKEDEPELFATYGELQAMLEHLRNMDLPYYYNLL